MNSPLVSVLMAEYNTPAANLSAAIESVLQQTFSDFEFVIVNDASPTDLEPIIQKFDDSRVRLVRHGENRGFIEALNTGLSVIASRYVARIDSDDIWEPSHLKTLLVFAEGHPEFSVVSTRAREFCDDGTVGIVVGRAGEKSAREVMRGDTPVHAASILRLPDVEGVGGYPSRPRAEDLALWCELLVAGKRLIVLPDVTYLYRVNPGDYRKRRLKQRRGEIAARLYYYPLLGAGPVEYWRVVRTVLAGILPSELVRRLRVHLYPQN